MKLDRYNKRCQDISGWGFNRAKRGFFKVQMVDSSGVCSGKMVCNPVASKDPCWSSFHLNGGEGGSSVTGGRPRKLRDWRSSGSSTM
jgi:hypothetical protein